MSLQWTAVATFLYTELFLCIVLMLPGISAQRWQKIFRSRLFNVFSSYANLYFNIFIAILLILFVDSIRDMFKYQSLHETYNPRVATEASKSSTDMKMFRAQRNFYIAGFALFMLLVLRKLVTMIAKEAKLQAEGEAARAQAKSASQAATTLLESQADKDDNKDNEELCTLREQLSNSKVTVMELRNDIEKGKSDLAAMKKQAEATNREYDRLVDEHTKLEKKLQAAAGEEEGSKKDD